MSRDAVDRCCELLLQSKRTVCLTGAGISTGAGIPDFRGPQGLYVSRLYDPEKVFDIDYFLKDPKPFYEFARDFIGLESSIQPTTAHFALSALESSGRLQAVITQNIDGLHQKAGSKKVLEMHGSFLRSHCLKCHKTYDYADLKTMVLKQGIAHCSCRGILKPDIVFFGEDVKYYHESVRLAQEADLFFVIGTSLTVYPAASLPQFAPGKIVIINDSKLPLNMYNNALVVESDIDAFFNELMGEFKQRSNL
ncbi:MAG: Sir2 family NAD-dependent protein deacetylase [Candidatus Omnitrophica bacterium]|nr:Sir2 family NAD-dependent protein deacetylase [Candidatus Omnitrophota bacterium]